jgi:hypothetical protein
LHSTEQQRYHSFPDRKQRLIRHISSPYCESGPTFGCRHI